MFLCIGDIVPFTVLQVSAVLDDGSLIQHSFAGLVGGGFEENYPSKRTKKKLFFFILFETIYSDPTFELPLQVLIRGWWSRIGAFIMKRNKHPKPTCIWSIWFICKHFGVLERVFNFIKVFKVVCFGVQKVMNIFYGNSVESNFILLFIIENSQQHSMRFLCVYCCSVICLSMC